MAATHDDPKLGDLFPRDIVLMKQVGMNRSWSMAAVRKSNKMLDRVGHQEQLRERPARD